VRGGEINSDSKPPRGRDQEEREYAGQRGEQHNYHEKKYRGKTKQAGNQKKPLLLVKAGQ